MEVGFTAIAQHRRVELEINSPPNNQETALITSPKLSEYRALLMGRLYYQHELLDRLKPHWRKDDIEESRANAALLALATYRQFGAVALEQLEGDFALVLWDAETAELIGMRDPMGGYPLFWIEQADTIVFSTSMGRLLDRLPQRLLEPEYFAEFLTMPNPQNEGATELCAYKNIHRVLPGTVVCANLISHRVERHSYWDWRQKITDPGSSYFPEIAQQYADVLRIAVGERLHGRTLAHLSGGMDSTSVALLARDEIRTGKGQYPLHTLSLVYDKFPILARERPYIESVLENETEIVAHRLPGDKLLDFDSFIDPPLHDEPYSGLWCLAKDRATVKVASQIGAATLLTGIGADEIHEMHPYYLSDLLRQGRFFRAWQEATKWAQAKDCNPWGFLQPFGIVPLIPVWLLELFGSQQHDLSIAPWIRKDFADRYDLKSRAIENINKTYHLCDQTCLSVTLSTLASRPGDVLRWSVATPLGIAIAHPFLDSRVLALGLGIQKQIIPEPSKMKPVLAEAMRNLLPQKIANRKRKGHFNEVYYLGLAKNVQALEGMRPPAKIGTDYVK